MESVKKTTAENISSLRTNRSRHIINVDRRSTKIHYHIGDEVLLFNARKRGRKERRIKPDFSGQYVIQLISGKLVTLSNSKGATLKTKYNVDRIKPYIRS